MGKAQRPAWLNAGRLSRVNEAGDTDRNARPHLGVRSDGSARSMSATVDQQSLERLRDQRFAAMKADHLEIIGQPAFARSNGFVGDRDRLVERDNKERMCTVPRVCGCAGRSSQPVKLEVRPIDERYVSVLGNASTQPTIVDSSVSHCDTRVEVQFTRAAVIIKAVGDIGVLLHFDECQAGPDGVDRPGRKVDEIAGCHRAPIEQAFD